MEARDGVVPEAGVQGVVSLSVRSLRMELQPSAETARALTKSLLLPSCFCFSSGKAV